MMLMPPDRLHVAHMARTASELNASDHFASLPALVSPARSLPAHRRPAAAGSLSPTRQTGKRGGRITGSPMRATGGSYDRLAGAMTFAEIAKVGPTSVEALKFSEASAPRKSKCMGTPLGGDQEALLQEELEQLAKPGPQEAHMSEEQQSLVAGVRTEVLMFKPNKALLLNNLHDLVELLVTDIVQREKAGETLRTTIKDLEQRAAAAQQHAEEEMHKKEELIADKDKQLMQDELKRSEMEEQIKALEERLNTAAGIGMTADEAARTMLQLTKAKASIEALKKQISGLEDKVVVMEKQKRAEETALKEKKAAIERQLKETLEQYGPEKFRALTEQLHEASHELSVTSENLSKSKIAQRQQHKLVVSWRIQFDEITEKMAAQSKEMEGLNDDIKEKARQIADLEAQLWQSEQDLKKQSIQLTSLNEKLNEYIEKYTRQASYISQMEAQWQAAEAQRLIAESAQDEDED